MLFGGIKMKKLAMFSIAIILFACLFAGCGGGDDDDDDDDDDNLVGPGGPEGNPDIPGGGDIPGGAFVITVGPGARPTISVSPPIQSLLVMQGAMPVWHFDSPGVGQPGGLFFAGPFQYGVEPNGARSNFPNPPDMIAGQSYTIQVAGINNAGAFIFGSHTFTR